MLRSSNFTNTRIKRLKRRAFIKKIRPYVLFILAVFIGFTLFKLLIKPVPCVSEVHTTQTIVVKDDKREQLLTRFFEEKQSPLTSYSEYFIETADKYGLDWTLMPGISGVESSFGKKMPKESNNPFGLERGGQRMSFPTLYSAIEYEGKLLSENYKLVANRAIGYIYCPEQACTQNWAITVTGFSKEIRN